MSIQSLTTNLKVLKTFQEINIMGACMSSEPDVDFSGPGLMSLHSTDCNCDRKTSIFKMTLYIFDIWLCFL